MFIDGARINPIKYGACFFIQQGRLWLVETHKQLKHTTVDQEDGSSIPPAAVSKLWQFRSLHFCLCLSEEIRKVVGLFYLVYNKLSMPGEVKDATQGNGKNIS